MGRWYNFLLFFLMFAFYGCDSNSNDDSDPGAEYSVKVIPLTETIGSVQISNGADAVTIVGEMNTNGSIESISSVQVSGEGIQYPLTYELDEDEELYRISIGDDGGVLLFNELNNDSTEVRYSYTDDNGEAALYTTVVASESEDVAGSQKHGISDNNVSKSSELFEIYFRTTCNGVPFSTDDVVINSSVSLNQRRIAHLPVEKFPMVITGPFWILLSTLISTIGTR